MTGVLMSDDDTIPTNSAFRQFSKTLEVACAAFGTPVDDPTRWKEWFESRGFTGVTQQVFKMPCSPWPKDRRLKVIGAWEQHNLLNNLEGMVMRLFQKGLGWSEEKITVFLAELRGDIRNLGIHAYWPL